MWSLGSNRIGQRVSQTATGLPMQIHSHHSHWQESNNLIKPTQEAQGLSRMMEVVVKILDCLVAGPHLCKELCSPSHQQGGRGMLRAGNCHLLQGEIGHYTTRLLHPLRHQSEWFQTSWCMPACQSGVVCMVLLLWIS